MKKVIVTGATGFVGSWLVRTLIKEGVQVYSIVRSNSKNQKSIPKSEMVRIVYCNQENLSLLSELIKETNFDSFYHLSWSGVSGVERTNSAIQLDNIRDTIAALHAAADLECKKFVCIGSIMEEETYAVSQTNGTTPGLGYIYGASKFCAHAITKAIAGDLGIEHIWASLTNAYGEGEFSPRLINSTIRKIINDEPLKFTSGTQNYDFIHVEDVAKALYLIGKNGKNNHMYTIGSGQAKPLRAFLKELGQCLAPEKELFFGEVPFTGVNLPLQSFAINDLVSDTGFQPSITFPEGLSRTKKWIEENQ